MDIFLIGAAFKQTDAACVTQVPIAFIRTVCVVSKGVVRTGQAEFVAHTGQPEGIFTDVTGQLSGDSAILADGNLLSDD